MLICLPSDCHPIAIRLPSDCHPIAIRLSSDCHPIAIRLPSDCHPIASWRARSGLCASPQPPPRRRLFHSPRLPQPAPSTAGSAADTVRRCLAHVSLRPRTGATACVGASAVLYLCQGATFLLKYDDNRTGEHQEAEITWMGVRTQVIRSDPIRSESALWSPSWSAADCPSACWPTLA